MTESNVVTVTYSEEVPTGKIKCWFCEETFDSYEAMFKHLSEKHQTELAIIGIAIVIVIALLFYWLRE